jgi:hypothetical protein
LQLMEDASFAGGEFSVHSSGPHQAELYRQAVIGSNLAGGEAASVDITKHFFPMALARAMRERTEYAFATERFTFNTTEDWYGWVRSGDTFKVTNKFIPDASNNYSWGITNEPFICTSNSITFGSGGYRIMQITSVRI